MEKVTNEFIRWFEEIGLSDVPLVGGKNASLGEMYRALTKHGIRVPNGFAITANAYRYFLKETGIQDRVTTILAELENAETEQIQAVGKRVRALLLETELPAPLQKTIKEAYQKLGGAETLDVAVRSSATAEDLPSASFAGQQETYLNVRGQAALIDACRRCFASLFTDRALTYRQKMGFNHVEVALSIGVQKMVRSDLACSGVLFTLDTESGFRDVVLIEASYGLGENIVQGIVNPDDFFVFKTTLSEGFKPIIEKKLGSKEVKLVYDEGGGKQVRNIGVAPEDRQRFCLTDEEVLTLARWGCLIEGHYSALLKHPSPMDIEWAKDGKTGEIYIVQARPETVHSQKQAGYETYHLTDKGKVLVTGHSVGERIGSGVARVIKNVTDLSRLEQGNVLVTENTNPDWEPYMRKVAAIVTDRGGRTCHAAIVSRELQIPAVVGTENGTTAIRDGQTVTISCAEGEVGNVYDGLLKYEKQSISSSEIPRTKTKIMLNVADPSQAFHQSFIPNDGVGLARMEFIINNYIKIHPMALLRFDELEDLQAKAAINSLLTGFPDRKTYFIEKLARGIAMIGAAFYPKDVIVRFSDFKTNEYAALLGGKQFEPHEENPMLGFRGASRYYHPLYREAFGLECAAIRRVRETMGLVNVKVMIPFCRTVEEGRKVLEEMKKHGLERGNKGLEVYMMCEIPSNVILAKEFALLFDGFSIGSNDLTQLVLGVDRDSALVASLFDERNAAVKSVVSQVIKSVKEAGKKIGICGQAPSDFPDFAQFLVEQGIDSVSLSPDSAIKVSLSIIKAETLLSMVG